MQNIGEDRKDAGNVSWKLRMHYKRACGRVYKDIPDLLKIHGRNSRGSSALADWWQQRLTNTTVAVIIIEDRWISGRRIILPILIHR